MSTQARKVLKQWSMLHAATLSAIDEYVESCDAKALDQLERAASGLNQTNCWFVTYDIRDTVLDAIRRERYVRRTRAALVAPSRVPGEET